jgi:hypothetical protein
MHGPTCSFWANLTPFSLQMRDCHGQLLDNPMAWNASCVSPGVGAYNRALAADLLGQH